MNKIAEWWWAHETVRVIGAVVTGFVCCYVYVWYTWVWLPRQDDEEHIRCWYEGKHRDQIALQAALDELNRKLESGELP